MDDPFVTVVNQASAKYFGNAPLHAKPSPSVELPPSPSSHQQPKPIKTFDRSRIFPASSSTLSATALPFEPQTTSLDAQLQGGKKWQITYPLESETVLNGQPLGKHLQNIRNVSSEHRSRIETLDRKMLAHMQSSHSPSDDGQSWSWQLPPHLLAADNTNQMSRGNTPYKTPPQKSSGQNRRQMANSDGPFLHKRLAIPRGSSCPSLSLGFQTPKASTEHHKVSQPILAARSSRIKPSLPYPPSPASFSIPKSRDQRFSYPDFNHSSRIKSPTIGKLSRVEQGSFQADQNGDSHPTVFDHYTPTPTHQPTSQSQINPYAQDSSTMGSGTYFPGTTNYPQQVSCPWFSIVG